MHTILGFFCLLLVLCGGGLTLKGLEPLHDWSKRRRMQLLILMTPFLSLGLAAGSWQHLDKQGGVGEMPLWDVLLGVLLPLSIPLVVLLALVLLMVRLLLLRHSTPQHGIEAPLPLQDLVTTLAHCLQVRPPRVLVCIDDRPRAVTYGITHPTILLSTWMLSQLDQHELEAVLTHELAHVARRDYLFMILATLLRDAFFYLPTSQIVYRQLRQEKELVCDDTVVRVTHRPLALASALTKVWLHALETSTTTPGSIVQSLQEGKTSIQDRIERLLRSNRTPIVSSRVPTRPIRRSLFPLLASLMIHGINLLLVFVLLTHHSLPFTEDLFSNAHAFLFTV